ncbi:MAG TPA: Maf family protein [Pseudomonadales bacterium]
MNSASPHAQVYLASASPRRRELLAQVGLVPEILVQDIDESPQPGELPEAYVTRLAREKAQAALRDPRCRQPLPVIAADTTVVCAGRVLGKPASLDEARTMLRLLSGHTHQVMTAVAVAFDGHCELALVATDVRFRPIDDDEIAAYWATGEPRDKAGGYGIQGLGAMFVSRIDGSYSGVMGLPLFETLQLLKRCGVSPLGASGVRQGAKA